jgi:hypothetical protein
MFPGADIGGQVRPERSRREGANRRTVAKKLAARDRKQERTAKPKRKMPCRLFLSCLARKMRVTLRPS